MNITQTKIDSMRRTAKRELDKRKYFYPKLIESGKLSQEKADFELQGMQEIVEYFDWLMIHTEPEQGKLF